MFLISGSITMEEDIEYKIEYNPWEVKQLDEFLFYCCPECENKSLSKKVFINHALSQHPLVR